MSKKCRNCGCSEIDQTGRYVDGSVGYKCRKCGTHFILFNVFKTITSSPEVLAENLIHCIWYPTGRRWISTIIVWKEFENKSEAIAATVAKLNEVCDE